MVSMIGGYNMKLKWSGRKVLTYREPVGEIQQWIPHFSRVPWRLSNEGSNEYLDVIIREPLENDAKYIKDRVKIPVCTATKRYALFQHQDVFYALVRALERKVSNLRSHRVELKITEYGEHMWVSFVLANFQLNETERYPLRLEVSGLNAIGAGTALDILLSWYEVKSGVRIPYGMVSAHEVDFKKPHRRRKKSVDSDVFAQEIFLFLTEQLEQLSRERKLYQYWKSAEINRGSLAHWVDTIVEKKWGYEEAVRVYHVAMTGQDVKVIDNKNQEENRKKRFPVPSKLN